MPLTATPRGYREIFQAGEVYDGEPIVDRQHPHDFVMQAAVVWRVPIDYRPASRSPAAPVGEPALGPIAFMHRPSAAENPAAPLGHHTLDSTHIAMGVVTAGARSRAVDDRVVALQRTRAGRQPLGRDGSGRARFVVGARAGTSRQPEWQFQVSHGFLKQPEAFEPGDIKRTTASGVVVRARGQTGSRPSTVAYGRNDTDHGAFNALLAEATDRRGNVAYGRFEIVQVETAPSGKSARRRTRSNSRERGHRALTARRGARRGAMATASKSASAATSRATSCPDALQAVVRQPPGVVSPVRAGPSAGRSHGPDVEHADGEADAVT